MNDKIQSGNEFVNKVSCVGCILPWAIFFFQTKGKHWDKFNERRGLVTSDPFGLERLKNIRELEYKM